MTTTAAWQLATGLSAFDVTEIPRDSPPGADGGKGNNEGPDRWQALLRRSRALAASCAADNAVAFGWIRMLAGGPVRVITAGSGVRSSRSGPAREDGRVLMSYPPGGLGVPLAPGGLAEAFAALPCWATVAALPDELLRQKPAGDGGSGGGPGSAFGVALEESLLGSWEDPFAFLVIAEPVGEDERLAMLDEVSLAQQLAQRHDTPRARIAVRRAETRHDELRTSSARGLWRFWLLAGSDSPGAAREFSAVLRTALDLGDLPFGLVPGPGAGTLPELLGAPPGITDGKKRGKDPGPLASEVTGWYAGDDPRGSRPRTMPMSPGAKVLAAPGTPAITPGQGTAPDSRPPAETVQDSPSWAPPGSGGAGNAVDRARRDAEAERARRAARATEEARNEAATRGGYPGPPPAAPGGWNGNGSLAFPPPPPVAGTPSGQPSSGQQGYPGAQRAQPGQPGWPENPAPPPQGFPGQYFYDPPPAPPSQLPPAQPQGGTGARPAWLGGPDGIPPTSRPGGPGQPGQEQGGRDASLRDKPSPTRAKAADFPDPEPEWPCRASSHLLAALMVPPSEEIPGVEMMLKPEFDVTAGTAVPAAGEGIRAGAVLDRHLRPVQDLRIGMPSLNRHVFVCGATGAGKSQTVRHLLESATAEGIPWLAVEPAKAEYASMARRLGGRDVIVIRPGDLAAVPAGINPLEPATGPGGTRFPLQAHSDLVRGLFLAAFQADEPFPQVLARALERVYREAGWDMLTGSRSDGSSPEGAAYPTLADLQAAAMKVVEDIGYSQEITDNVRGFVSVRIGSLLVGTAGGFLHGAFPLDFGKLLESNVVLEIEDVGDDSEKAFVMGSLIVRLSEHLRMRTRSEGQPGRLRHLTVIEEAHRLLRKPPEGSGAGAAAKAVEMFADVLAEIRAYGEGIIIAEQIPSKLIADVIKNTAVKFVHRLPADDDRSAVGATMNLTDQQSRYLVTLPPGTAAVFFDGMDYPMLVRMPDGTERESAPGGRKPADARGLVGSRSRACPGDCGSTPCTLGQIAAARQGRTRDGRLTLWAELTVTAHLGGWGTPVPGPGFMQALERMNARERDCALAHAAEDAAAARASLLTPGTSPAALAAHAADSMRALAADQSICATGELDWMAPPGLWAQITSTLRAVTGDEQDKPHPRTGEWEKRLGRPVPGDTCPAQLANASAQAKQAWARDGAALFFGTAEPSAIETAVSTRAHDPDWPDRIRRALDDAFPFGQLSWALDYLIRPEDAEAARGGEGAA